jgi:hypothetical protein
LDAGNIASAIGLARGARIISPGGAVYDCDIGRVQLIMTDGRKNDNARRLHMIPPDYYGAEPDDERAFDAAAEILAERLRAANQAIRDAARIALPAVAFLESLGVTVNGYDLSRDETLAMLGGISASAEADILNACVHNYYATAIDALNGLMGDAEQAQADAIAQGAAIDAAYNGEAS